MASDRKPLKWLEQILVTKQTKGSFLHGWLQGPERCWWDLALDSLSLGGLHPHADWPSWCQAAARAPGSHPRSQSQWEEMLLSLFGTRGRLRNERR